MIDESGAYLNMQRHHHRPTIAGALLAVVGTLLPWEVGGDFVPYTVAGVQLAPTVRDNGGVLVLLIAAATVLLRVLRFRYGKAPAAAAVVMATLLVLVVLTHLLDKILLSLELAAVVGAPGPGIGLCVILVGAVLLLIGELRRA
jgi:hypothetical protein